MKWSLIDSVAKNENKICQSFLKNTYTYILVIYVSYIKFKIVFGHHRAKIKMNIKINIIKIMKYIKNKY